MTSWWFTWNRHCRKDSGSKWHYFANSSSKSTFWSWDRITSTATTFWTWNQTRIQSSRSPCPTRQVEQFVCTTEKQCQPIPKPFFIVKNRIICWDWSAQPNKKTRSRSILIANCSKATTTFLSTAVRTPPRSISPTSAKKRSDSDYQTMSSREHWKMTGILTFRWTKRKMF